MQRTLTTPSRQCLRLSQTAAGQSLNFHAVRHVNVNQVALNGVALVARRGYKMEARAALVPTYDDITKSKTYQELLQWDRENPQENVKIRECSAIVPGEMPNHLAKSQPSSAWRDLREATLDSDAAVAGADSNETFEESSSLAVGMQCKVGTLVEIRSQDSRIPLMAIVVQTQRGKHYLYSSTGQLLYKSVLKPGFFVPDFIQPEDLELLRKYIPGPDADPKTIDDHQPLRTDCAKLLNAMRAFLEKSASQFQLNISAIITAHEHIADQEHHTYVSITELAENVFSKSHGERYEKSRRAAKFEGAEKPTMRRGITPDMKRDFTTPAALYAVHRCIMEHHVQAFSMTSIADSEGRFLYEVIPLSWARDIAFTEQQVRSTMEGAGWPLVNTLPFDNNQQLQDFLKRARNYIKISRESRPWTETGTIGPILNKPDMPPPMHLAWKKSDLRFLRFIEIWSCYDQFPAGERLHSIGSQLLRLTEMYTEADLLSNSLGWTFLQEVRQVVPWDIQARYVHRFPGMQTLKTREGLASSVGNDGMSETHATGYERILEPSSESSMRNDIAAGHRRSWKGANVFAIDEESTTLLDDAISLERIPDKPNESWIHVHVADLAAFLIPNSPLGRWVETMPQNMYLPGNLENMFPHDFVKDVIMPRFSLEKDRPCLTFSARVNSEGHILATKIEPGVLSDVVCIKGSEASKAIPENKRHRMAEGQSFVVGELPDDVAFDRGMTSFEELSQEQKDDLARLQELGEALRKERVANLGFPGHISKPQVYVAAPKNSDHQKDPYIRISYSEGGLSGDVVSSHMQLAGQIAAKWCAERGVPAPFRTQPQAEERKAQLEELWKKAFPNCDSLLDKSNNTQASRDAFNNLIAEAGPVELSVIPGPLFAMGIDMYAKATSPLRRYADLLLHWQIHSVLAQERDAQDSETPLKPAFSAPVLERKLQAIRNRERIARRLEGVSGSRQWILQALARAWKFGQAELPATFRFTVEEVMARSAIGSLNWFDQRAVATVESFDDVPERLINLQKGDVFEVELSDVNVHGKRITVKILKKLEE
ncbi:hypothetical protein BROUX41_000881 [Berkeleyomyces rouxiae]|uniref:uncharacterized protein n=1 Tax=Berkeleyomyces rouxiae TaxID=2035830 RepID=UPI003B7A9FBA